MRATALLTAVALSVPAAAGACTLAPTVCPGIVGADPAPATEGLRVGTVAVRVIEPLRPERSRFTGQPSAVLYNNPAVRPGSVDPGLTLVPLPKVPHFRMRAVEPRG